MNRELPTATRWAIAISPVFLTAAHVYAGGGGQNMLLVVNPNDENAIRIATAYAEARAIPDSNIVFIAPPASTRDHGTVVDLTGDEFMNLYVTPLSNEIASRGLANQIDYIGTIGQPQRVKVDSNITSFTADLSLLTPLASGTIAVTDVKGKTSKLYQSPSLYDDPPESPNNFAISHATVHPDGILGNPTQYYMAGAIAYTHALGSSPGQTIANFQNSALADGTRPEGTVYFENSGDVLRSGTRLSGWNIAEAALGLRGVPTVEESGVTPSNAPAVRGAMTGKDVLNLPNGSTYIPGSWADNLTSNGNQYNERAQSKAAMFIASGASSTSGTVTEPGATQARFPHAMIHTYIADGSTHGEAFAKSVELPDMQMYLGDMLAQPYADVPTVQVISGPQAGATVSGTVAIEVAGSLSNPTIATDVAKLQLYLDGKPVSSVSEIAGANGTFNLDTTQLSDGKHELRIVAINNAAAASQGYLLQDIYVNNKGQSVTPSTASLSLGEDQTGSVNVNVNVGSGTLSRIELRQLGRVIGQTTSNGGSINIDATQLGYGSNPIVPVAVFSDGSTVAGDAITVMRNPTVLAGRTQTAAIHRTPGVQVEYFYNKAAHHVWNAGATITEDQYAGTPDRITHQSGLNLRNPIGTYQFGGPPPEILDVPVENAYNMALRITGSFNIEEGKGGEYQFFFWLSSEMARLYIDGKEVQGFDAPLTLMKPATTTEADSVFLGEGEHDLTLLLSQTDFYPIRGYTTSHITSDVSLYMRGPDGFSRIMDNTIMYTVPEPSSLVFVFGGGIALLARRRGNADVAN